MGWSIVLRADRSINEADVTGILTLLSGKDMSLFPNRQAWGWPSTATGLPTDVQLPTGRILCVIGAWFSSQFAEDTANTLAARLRERGYIIQVGALHG
jgi:hypothetical protein